MPPIYFTSTETKQKPLISHTKMNNSDHLSAQQQFNVSEGTTIFKGKSS